MCILGFSNKYGLTITYELISLHTVNKDCAPMCILGLGGFSMCDVTHCIYFLYLLRSGHQTDGQG
jgi:hypothetical protein